jgi:hypothetical protein
VGRDLTDYAARTVRSTAFALFLPVSCTGETLFLELVMFHELVAAHVVDGLLLHDVLAHLIERCRNSWVDL